MADATARTVTLAMSATLGQSFVVDNRPSAGSVVGGAAVAKATADGYTLLLMSNANAIGPHLFKKLPCDATRDFAPITTLGFFDLAVFVAADARWRTLGEIVAQAKASPGRLTVGTISVGSTQHLAAELFKTQAGVDVLIVPYKATPAVLAALRAGEIDLAFEILGPMLSQVGARTIRALAVSSPQRYPAWSGVPTVFEAGVPGYTVASWNALAAPAGTPAPVIERLNRAALQALAQPAVARRLQDPGVRAQGGTPAELQALLQSETRRWGDVVHAAKIAPQ